jgi:hypothetical protein
VRSCRHEHTRLIFHRRVDFRLNHSQYIPLKRDVHKYISKRVYIWSRMDTEHWKLITRSIEFTEVMKRGITRCFFFLAFYAWPRTPPTKVTRKERNPWRQHVHRATRARSYAIDKLWEAVTSRGPMLVSYHVKSIICYLCFMQHAWSC